VKRVKQGGAAQSAAKSAAQPAGKSLSDRSISAPLAHERVFTDSLSLSEVIDVTGNRPRDGPFSHEGFWDSFTDEELAVSKQIHDHIWSPGFERKQPPSDYGTFVKFCEQLRCSHISNNPLLRYYL